MSAPPTPATPKPRSPQTSARAPALIGSMQKLFRPVAGGQLRCAAAPKIAPATNPRGAPISAPSLSPRSCASAGRQRTDCSASAGTPPPPGNLMPSPAISTFGTVVVAPLAYRTVALSTGPAMEPGDGIKLPGGG